MSALLIVAVALITLDFRSGGQSPLHNAGAAVFGPIERGAGYLTRPVAGAFDAVTGDDSGEISALQQQNDELRAQLSQAQNAEAKDPQLSSLLQLAGRGGYRVVAASVVGAGGSYSDTVSIDAGSRDGIALNDTVLNGDGLVGTVTQVAAVSSTVLLATDADSTVGVQLAAEGAGEAGGEIGAVTGTGSTMAGANSLRLRLFSANVTLKPGEQLVTFGSVDDTPYVPGVPVGTITSVTSTPGSLTQTAQVSPFADFSSLGVVGVVVAPPRTDPRYSVLPKKAG
ncbi:MAG: rod shape-determining protein MreC [Streptosporangiaceae bacterium]